MRIMRIDATIFDWTKHQVKGKPRPAVTYRGTRRWLQKKQQQLQVLKRRAEKAHV